jgi:hypothetical protein
VKLHFWGLNSITIFSIKYDTGEQTTTTTRYREEEEEVRRKKSCQGKLAICKIKKKIRNIKREFIKKRDNNKQMCRELSGAAASTVFKVLDSVVCFVSGMFSSSFFIYYISLKVKSSSCQKHLFSILKN